MATIQSITLARALEIEAAVATKITNPAQTENIADSAITSAKIADGTIVSADLAALDYVQYNTLATGVVGAPGKMTWNDTDGTLEFQLKGGNVTLQIGQEQVVRVKNSTGGALTNGKAVYINGSNGSNLTVAYANAGSESTSAGTIGVLTEDLNNGNHGYVTTFGLVREINTSALTEGAAVWLSTTNGVLTATRPTAPNHAVLVGFCLRAHATQGVIFVRVDNGWELDELHNVAITNPQPGQALTYDATGVWKNSTPASTLDDLSDVTITSPADKQVLAYEASTSQWKNKIASGGVTVSATAPASPIAGDAWFDSNDGTLYVYYNDGNTYQWVQVQANSALEGSILARLSSLEGQAIAYGTQSPNYLINGGFDIWQRGTSFAANGYGPDRFYLSSGGATWTRDATNIVANTQYSLKATMSSASQPLVYQAVETLNVIPMQGKNITLSGYMACSSAVAGLIRIEYSTSVDNSVTGTWTTLASTVTTNLTTTLTRYSVTALLPANAQTVRVLCATNVNLASSATFTVGAVQLEVGSNASPFRRNAPSIQAELAACNRYYVRTPASAVSTYLPTSGITFSTNLAGWFVPLPTQMAKAPVLEISALSTFTASSPSGAASAAPTGFGISLATPWTAYLNMSWTSAQSFTAGSATACVIAPNGFIAFNAEL